MKICDTEDETLEHFILNCMHLELTRNSVVSDISHEVDSLLGASGSYVRDLTDHEKLRIILDCAVLVDKLNGKLHIEQLGSLEFHTRRLMHNLTGVRYRPLRVFPKWQR